MAHVVTERCVDCRYTDCCAVCPVDCFYEITSPAMLVIDPDTCIDCALCVPECPIQAIWPESELPEVYADWIGKNAELFGGGTMIKTKKDALAGALSLGRIQTREQERGWLIEEPSGAKGGHVGGEPAEATTVAAESAPAPMGLSASESSVFQAVATGRYRWRTVKSVAKQVRLPQGTVKMDLDKLVSLGHLESQPPKSNGATVYRPQGRA